MSFLQDLLSLPVPTSPRISPDGQKIVYTTSLPYGHKTGDHFRSTLWLAKTGKRDSARPVTSGEFNDREPRWCPDGRGIVFLSDRGKVGEGCAVYALEFEEEGGGGESPGEVWPVTEEGNLRAIDRLEVLPNGSSGGGEGGKVVYLSADEKSEEVKARERKKDDARVWGEDWAYNRLRMVDLNSRESTTLVRQDAHLLDLACSEDGSKIAVSYVRNPDPEAKYLYGTTVAVYDLGTEGLTEVCHFATYITDLTWVGRSLYFIGPADETTAASSQMVFRIDLSTAIQWTGYTKQAYGEVNCAMKLKRLGTALAIGIQDGMADEIHLLEGRESRTLFTRTQTLEAWDAIFRPDSDDEIILALTTSSPSHPTEIYTTTVASSLGGGGGGGRAPLTPLSTHGKNLTTAYPDEAASTHCEFLTCASLDGTVQLEATLFLPTSKPTRPRQPFPTLVALHGGPYYRFTSLFPLLLPHSIFTILLLSAGYAILAPNYRGSSGRGRAFAEFGKNGGSGREGYEDVITLTTHAIREGYVDPARAAYRGN
ncbi:putative acylamino-acid-releasing enzyme [Hortaea werneckii]|nr:putative acylamino-acid-releasing enzyme [Hortaea werneckii]